MQPPDAFLDAEEDGHLTVDNSYSTVDNDDDGE